MITAKVLSVIVNNEQWNTPMTERKQGMNENTAMQYAEVLNYDMKLHATERHTTERHTTATMTNHRGLCRSQGTQRKTNWKDTNNIQSMSTNIPLILNPWQQQEVVKSGRQYLEPKHSHDQRWRAMDFVGQARALSPRRVTYDTIPVVCLYKPNETKIKRKIAWTECLLQYLEMNYLLSKWSRKAKGHLVFRVFLMIPPVHVREPCKILFFKKEGPPPGRMYPELKRGRKEKYDDR